MASFQDRAQHTIAQLDKELSKYPVLNNLERQTSVPKVYVILGLGGIYTFLVFFNIAGQLLVNLAGFLLPTYYSLDALFSAGKADDTQWLTYWVVYAFFTVIESAISAPYWFPFYYIFKFALVLWLALPQTSGAQVVFNSLLQPLVGRYFHGGSTSANLRAQADAATKSQ
ncbi:putative membrane biogenesis protein (Yop1) [Aspergillus mulundensis]|uniref:Protein YOP1 n=1 Tax=Aspergillus mulundensis TaxID=1810919 RepID=A0A3D8RY78_9EURO|nr:Protein yop1 [Aspergillus mulundensis]RDW78781.1 Protein yop1 [Aspergillus mulundensis]